MMNQYGSYYADSNAGLLFLGRAIQNLQHLQNARHSKKKAHRAATYWTNKGYTVLVQDEAHVQMKIVPRKT